MRAVENAQLKIAYFPVPKVASTSMKLAFYQLEHGAPFEEANEDIKQAGIHKAYFSSDGFYQIDRTRYKDYARIAIIRDPVMRVLSAFRHRVQREGELSDSRIDMDLARALGVGPNPNRSEFLRNIEKYRVLSKAIRHHTDPFTKFLGHDLSYYTDVVKIGAIGGLAAQIEALTGRPFPLGHHQKGDDKPYVLRMDKHARNALLGYCAGDYALLKGYFAIPEALRD